MAKIFGLLTTAASIFIALLSISLFNFKVHSLTILFIIPAGSLALGGLAAFGYYHRVMKMGKKLVKTHYLFGVILALITMVGIEYGEYMITYVSADNVVNHRLQGEHISNYSLNDSNEPLTFKNYYSNKLDNSSVSISSRSNVNGGLTFETGRTMSTFNLVVQGLGFILGSLFGGSLLSDSKNHCQSCQRAYLKEHELFEIDEVDYDSIMVDLNKSIHDDNVYRFSDRIQQQKQIDNELCENIRYNFKIGQCPKCQEGYLIIRHNKIKDDGTYEEVLEQRKVTYLSRGIVADTLKTIGNTEKGSSVHF
ncbi:hypothetical protein J2T12_001276 [Paenibacillus anaericanus]|uniref:hypothetical protein n=1 Tax=Paenibacillus anaericanus TaxID=170367 RepID=UPI00278BA367|nr:hypothetical protein [Paenibacillus anaericanus]MDQ0087870.1 hypothetical protein [Paenibacillus anaericanus]